MKNILKRILLSFLLIFLSQTQIIAKFKTENSYPISYDQNILEQIKDQVEQETGIKIKYEDILHALDMNSPYASNYSNLNSKNVTSELSTYKSKIKNGFSWLTKKIIDNKWIIITTIIYASSIYLARKNLLSQATTSTNTAASNSTENVLFHNVRKFSKQKKAKRGEFYEKLGTDIQNIWSHIRNHK